MDISYSGSVLDVDGKSFIFPFDIGQVITDGEYVFVRLDLPMEKKYRHASTNIYGIRDGKVIWQNEDPHLVYQYDYCPFEGIYFEDGKLAASDFYALRVVFSKETGKVEGELPPGRW